MNSPISGPEAPTVSTIVHNIFEAICPIGLSMPKKDYRGFLAVVGEQLRQNATEKKAKRPQNDLDRGEIMGWAFALDTLWDCLGIFGLDPEDLNWQGFNPERDLLGAENKAAHRERT